MIRVKDLGIKTKTITFGKEGIQKLIKPIQLTSVQEQAITGQVAGLVAQSEKAILRDFIGEQRVPIVTRLLPEIKTDIKPQQVPDVKPKQIQATKEVLSNVNVNEREINKVVQSFSQATAQASGLSGRIRQVTKQRTTQKELLGLSQKLSQDIKQSQRLSSSLRQAERVRQIQRLGFRTTITPRVTPIKLSLKTPTSPPPKIPDIKFETPTIKKKRKAEKRRRERAVTFIEGFTARQLGLEPREIKLSEVLKGLQEEPLSIKRAPIIVPDIPIPREVEIIGITKGKKKRRRRR